MAASTPLLTSTPPPSDTSPLLPTTTKPTILYLAYGSNLCHKTFQGTRGIQPLTSTPVHVPTLTLTFSLPGLPYTEPCFANTSHHPPPASSPYHKDAWLKGLIGVVYEVTPEDYKTIIATEGGGSSYQDVLVDCFPLRKGAKTLEDALRTGEEGRGLFKAHTLLAPTTSKHSIQRPDPSYAQPSARYLALITSGAEEHSLPADYIAYLKYIRPYTITTFSQQAGQAVFLAAFMPCILALLGLGKVFADKEGKVPGWLANLMGGLFKAVWLVYDGVLKRGFGDGERTVGEGEGDLEEGGGLKRSSFRSEKRPATLEDGAS